MAENADHPTPTGQWPSPRMLLGATSRLGHHHRPIPRGRSHRSASRRPLLGLPLLILFGLLAAFFAWVTAEPLWLAVGRSTPGTATVIHCTGHGLDQRCRATFRADGAAFTAERVDLVGASRAQLADGARVSAQMVSAKGRVAYA